MFHYYLRQDLPEALDRFNVKASTLNETADRLRLILKEAVTAHGRPAHLLEVSYPEVEFPCISLDPWVGGTHNLRVSRLFEPHSPQLKAKGLAFPDHPLHSQLARIKAGKYYLLDDDSVTGTTFTKVGMLLKRYRADIQILGYKTLLKPQVAYYDVVDARDFIVGSQYGGLVVSLGGNLARVPYWGGVVDMESRASCLQDPTKAILQLNLDLYDAMSACSLKDLPPIAQIVFNRKGYAPETLMVDLLYKEILRWQA